MNFRSISTLALIAIFSLPIAAGAATTTTTTKHHKINKTNSKVPGSNGFSGSSPLGTAQKAAKKKKKKSM